LSKEPQPEPPAPTPAPPQGGGLAIPCGIRNYQVMSLDKGPNKLKATIRLEHAGKLHIDTLDLYTARARTRLAADLSRKFEQPSEAVEADITRIIRICENTREMPSEPSDPQAPAVTGREKEAALRFGRSKDLIQRILEDFATCGLIGEEANKLLGYIAMTSRKRGTPLSVQILSSSGAGKTALQDAVVGFCPPEDLVKLTSLSGKALFYKDRLSLQHKVLALEEGDGAEDASYAIRSLISSGVLINETTIKDLATGRLTTMENRVEGPTAVFYTTTNPDVDPETKSRFFVTGIDESREQTRKILAFQREKHRQDDLTASRKAGAVIRKHINFQRLLKPLGVKNPYSGQLTYGDDRLQGRRDQPKYLNLIKSVAFLRQMQKQVRSSGTSSAYIEVDPEDIRIANRLAQEILGRSLDELSRPGRDLLMLLDEMIEALFQKISGQHKDTRLKRTGITFSRRDIREYTGWSNYRVHTHIKELVNLEYVFVETGKNGSSFRYRLAYEGQGKDGSKFILGLADPGEL
jgi:PAS domain-containing protein